MMGTKIAVSAGTTQVIAPRLDLGWALEEKDGVGLDIPAAFAPLIEEGMALQREASHALPPPRFPFAKAGTLDLCIRGEYDHPICQVAPGRRGVLSGDQTGRSDNEGKLQRNEEQETSTEPGHRFFLPPTRTFGYLPRNRLAV
jgi:hypothetical protein